MSLFQDAKSAQPAEPVRAVGLDGKEPPTATDPVILEVLDTSSDREKFTADLAGKRVLHVKGFGSGFKNPNPAQVALEARQVQEAIDAMMQFNPDFLVADGDPWGGGFQHYIKAFLDAKCKREKSGGLFPRLIWAKPLAIEEGRPANVEERSKRIEQARRWAEQGISVIVFWIDRDLISLKIDAIFGNGTSKCLESETFDKRGAVRIFSDEPAAWVSGIDLDMLKTVQALEHEDRKSLQFLEKCSFENAAKGNVIFDCLNVPDSAAHGVISFGGGESVVLEFASLYLNSTSGFDKTKAAIYPYSRGREGTDPILTRHVGSAFIREEAEASATEPVTLEALL